MKSSVFHRTALSLVSGIALLATSAGPQAARLEVGAVTKTQNEVQAVYQTQSRQLQTESAVMFEDLVTTGADARLEAVLKDDTKITLGENAEIVVDEFVYDPAAQEGSLTLRVVEGAFLFVGGKIENMAKPEVTIMTPAAVLGVRGTTVWGGPIDGGYGVLVLDGQVEVRTAAGYVTLRANEATMIYGESRPENPGAWSEEKIGRAVATISFK